METLSEYFCVVTRPNQMIITKASTYEPKYTPMTRWEMIKDVLSRLGEYAILGFLYLLYVACLSIGVGLLLSNLISEL